MNQGFIIGHLASDVDTRYKDDLAIARFTVAVNSTRDEADFIRVTAFGKLAENCSKYIAKGSHVAVAYRVKTGSYKNKEGKTVYTTDFYANNVEFLSRKGEETEERKPEPRPAEPDVNLAFSASEEEIPF